MIMTNYRYNLSLDIKLQIPATSEEKDKSTEHNSEDKLHQKDEIISYQTAEMMKFYKYENIKFNLLAISMQISSDIPSARNSIGLLVTQTGKLVLQLWREFFVRTNGLYDYPWFTINRTWQNLNMWQL